MSKIASVDATALRTVLDLALRHNLMGLREITDSQRDAFYQCAGAVVTAIEPVTVPKVETATFLGLSQWGGEKIRVIKALRQYCTSHDHTTDPVIDTQTGAPLLDGLKACKEWSERRGQRIPLKLGVLLAEVEREYPGVALVEWPRGWSTTKIATFTSCPPRW